MLPPLNENKYQVKSGGRIASEMEQWNYPLSMIGFALTDSIVCDMLNR